MLQFVQILKEGYRNFTDFRGTVAQSSGSSIGRELPELTPVEIIGYEVKEAGGPLSLDNWQFTVEIGTGIHETKARNTS